MLKSFCVGGKKFLRVTYLVPGAVHFARSAHLQTLPMGRAGGLSLSLSLNVKMSCPWEYNYYLQCPATLVLVSCSTSTPVFPTSPQCLKLSKILKCISGDFL